MQEDAKTEAKGSLKIGLRISTASVVEPETLDSIDFGQPAAGLAATPLREVTKLAVCETAPDDSPTPGPKLKVAGEREAKLAPEDVSKDWSAYCDWRVSKCPPAHSRPRSVDATQATLELVGELAELSCLVGEYGAAVATDSEIRAKAIDEAGDVFFCGCWALDAWGVNFLRGKVEGHSGVSILASTSLADELKVRALFIEGDESAAAIFERYSSVVLMGAMAHAGMTANALKKSLYQHRDQDHEKQCELIVVAMTHVERLLVMLESGIEQALASNVAKLEHRFPNGYQGPGGGNRTGKGK